MSNIGKTIGKVFHRVKKTQEESKEMQQQNVTMPTPKVYLKALPLHNLSDVEIVKREVKSGNILILRISPLAKKSIEDVKKAVDELCEFTQATGGDIARLGEERVVVTPSTVRIWREKTAIPKEEAPTAA
ncbi:MAG: cell division protein SepF [Candidatus Bathyarchaeia archaeon]